VHFKQNDKKKHSELNFWSKFCWNV